mgnify:CR=1 FL=1
MTRAEFLQGLKTELEGRVPYSVIQENIRYYDSYILDEVNKGADEAEVIESLGGPKIIARTIVDAALDTETGRTVMRLTDLVKHRKRMPVLETGEYSGPYGTVDREDSYGDNYRRNVHYVDFSKWYVRLAAGLIVFFVIFLLMSLFFGIIGLAGWILSYIWPVLLILMIIWMFKGSGR